jgi:hypothetical protein
MTCLDPCGRSDRSPFLLIEDAMREGQIPSDHEVVWLKYGNDVVPRRLPLRTVQKIWDEAGFTVKAK